MQIAWGAANNGFFSPWNDTLPDGTRAAFQNCHHICAIENMNAPMPMPAWPAPRTADRTLFVDWEDHIAFVVEIQKNRRPPLGPWRARRSTYVELDLRQTNGRVPELRARSHARWPWLDAVSG